MKKILIVPDFGVNADNAAMMALKKAIESCGDYYVSLIDILAVVTAEHAGENLSEAQVIEQSALKLEKESESADALVVIGKSVMLARDISHNNVLFINPEYCAEWPWKKQYYSPLSNSPGHCRRYGIFTCSDQFKKFCDEYPGMAEMAPELEGDSEALAELICQFAEGNMIFPLQEVYKAIVRLSDSGNPTSNVICNFLVPIPLLGMSALGIRRGMPMANGQSGLKLMFAGHNDVPLEEVISRHDLLSLRDAILNMAHHDTTKKRIMIVPDYPFSDTNPFVEQLSSLLRQSGCQADIFKADDSFDNSRLQLESLCKSNHFDLIVTLESGCQLAAGIAYIPRIFVNPNWNSRKSNSEVAIKCDGEQVFGWFSEDAIDSPIAAAHLKLFNSNCFIPGLRLDTTKGIAILAKQIGIILSLLDK